MIHEIKAPKTGVCADVWKSLDRLHKSRERPTVTDILKVGRRRGWNENNTRVEFYRWRKAHGIQGRDS